jgi:hypothetical protein
MDILILLLIVLAVVSIGSWGYGTYGRTSVADGPVAPGPGWVNPMGIIGLILLVGLVMMLFTGWRPFAVAPMW